MCYNYAMITVESFEFPTASGWKTVEDGFIISATAFNPANPNLKTVLWQSSTMEDGRGGPASPEASRRPARKRTIRP